MTEFLKSKYLFIIMLFFVIGFYFYINHDKDRESLVSSDIWMNNFVMMQEVEHVWPEVPPNYSEEELYIAYPLLYYLNPGLDNKITSYHILAMLIVGLIFTINGLVIKKIFNSWLLGALGGFLCVMPRFIFPTRMGFLDISELRGNVFVFPFYLLLSYYWIVYGIKDKKKNILLAILAALNVYLYPPAGLVIMGLFGLTALIIHRKKYFKELIIFAVVYLAVASPFLINHFMNPDTKMLDVSEIRSAEDMQMQAEIVNYRFGANGFLTELDIARVKRGAWDSALLFLTFILSLFWYKAMKEKFSEEQMLAYRVSTIFVALMIMFIVTVEIGNAIMSNLGRPPLFVEHLRMMRATGYILIFQFILVVYFLYAKLNKKFLTILLSTLIIITPLRFSAPAVRIVVRAIVPESIRLKYNLAPIVDPADSRDFKNLAEMSDWVKNNTPNDIKVFTFGDVGDEFKFKILSRRNTNITVKEGSLWVTSGFENSKRWYLENKRYREIIDAEDSDFSQIVEFAKELNCTHILIPRGRFSEFYDKKKPDNVTEIHINKDYNFLKIN